MGVESNMEKPSNFLHYNFYCKTRRFGSETSGYTEFKRWGYPVPKMIEINTAYVDKEHNYIRFFIISLSFARPDFHDNSDVWLMKLGLNNSYPLGDLI